MSNFAFVKVSKWFSVTLCFFQNHCLESITDKELPRGQRILIPFFECFQFSAVLLLCVCLCESVFTSYLLKYREALLGSSHSSSSPRGEERLRDGLKNVYISLD